MVRYPSFGTGPSLLGGSEIRSEVLLGEAPRGRFAAELGNQIEEDFQ
jgi:hypothetical protein